MPASSRTFIIAASPIGCRIVLWEALLRDLAVVTVVETLRRLQEQPVIYKVERDDEVPQRGIADVAAVVAIGKCTRGPKHDVGIAIEQGIGPELHHVHDR